MTEQNSAQIGEAVEEAVQVAGDAARHPLTVKLARIGFYTKGYIFIVVGILALFVAFGINSGRITAPQGALSTIAQLPFGQVLLIIFIIGAVGHGVWNILRGIGDIDNCGKGFKGIILRIGAFCIGVFYLYLSWLALSLFLTGDDASDKGNLQRTFTSIILSFPLGYILLMLIGAGFVGFGIQQFYSGLTGKFKKHYKLYEIESEHLKIIKWLGYYSFSARSLIYILIGYYFFWAAVESDPNEAIGMDGALLKLSQTYYGKTFLAVMAVGLICHGMLAIYEGKYRKVC